MKIRRVTRLEQVLAMVVVIAIGASALGVALVGLLGMTIIDIIQQLF